MAASTSLSLYTPPTVSYSSHKHLSLPPHFTIPRRLNSRVLVFRPSVSRHREIQPVQGHYQDFKQRNNGKKSAFQADEEVSSSLKSLMQAYKKSIEYGDRKLMYEVEKVLVLMEKDNNEKVSELSALKEKHIRLQADFDNYRTRSDKERLKVRIDGQGEVIERLLPMVDSFECAKQQIKLKTESEKKIDSSYQGIYKQLREIMSSLRVAAVPSSVGRAFDPWVHEAIAREESNEYMEGIVTQELRRGFYLGDRLIRAAMVKVSSGPASTKY